MRCGGRYPPKKMKEIFLKRCVTTAKEVGAGHEKGNGGPEGSVGCAGAGIRSSSPQLSLQGINEELQRFTLEKGDDGANDDNNTEEDHLSCWSRNQLT